MATAKTTTRREKRLRVTTDPHRRVHCAGAFWAGISEVPADSVSEAQLLELKACKQLEVEIVDVDVDVPDAG
jgi:hypothetical protein